MKQTYYWTTNINAEQNQILWGTKKYRDHRIKHDCERNKQNYCEKVESKHITKLQNMGYRIKWMTTKGTMLFARGEIESKREINCRM
jgi:hypothetical protein